MKVKRPSVSMRRRCYRWLSYGAEVLDTSRADLFERIVAMYMSQLGISEPPSSWEPTPGDGRPPTDNTAKAIAENFSF